MVKYQREATYSLPRQTQMPPWKKLFSPQVLSSGPGIQQEALFSWEHPMGKLQQKYPLHTPVIQMICSPFLGRG